ncbi:MAG: hypothetical protein Q7R39_08680 [Dehalococcoidia bacterium]|nr:hypothetical protein [Dehalococcoidia bacterium]
MRDTSPELEERFLSMLMARSGEERVRMACDMHETARRLVLASLLAQNPNATPAELRKGLFLRFYRDDFSPEETRRILESLERA